MQEIEEYNREGNIDIPEEWVRELNQSTRNIRVYYKSIVKKL